MELVNSIPVVDISVLHQDECHENLKNLSHEIYSIYSQIGFAYIVNHGISQTLLDAVFSQSKLFHALPEHEKMKITQNQFFRGYMPMSGSTFNVSTLGATKNPNQSSAFILAHEVEPIDPDYQLGINLAGPNQWPSETLLPHFKNTLMQYREVMTRLARKLVSLFALALQQPHDAFHPYFLKPTTFLRLQYYPKQPDFIPENQYGIAPHTDYGFLTLLVQDNLGGLQVLSQNKKWIDVAPLSGGIILNTGDMLRRISSHQLLSTPHRVINTSGQERYSVPFFFEPSMHAMMTPIKSKNDQITLPPIEYATYLMERIKGNYDIGAKDQHDISSFAKN